MTRPGRPSEITPDILVRAYSIGLFPMAESAGSPSLFWVDPEARGIFPLDSLIVSKSLAKTVRSDRYEVSADRDFDGVVAACAMRDKTWINAEIRRLYGDLHRSGRAHSIEARDSEGLAGGLYGVSIGGAFFGESMFHLRADASKVALVHLVARLRAGGFALLDAQFLTPHLASLGAIEVPRGQYRLLLEAALDRDADFGAVPIGQALPGAEALRLATTRGA